MFLYNENYYCKVYFLGWHNFLGEKKKVVDLSIFEKYLHVYIRFNIIIETTWTESTVSQFRRGHRLKYARSGGICLHKPRKWRRSFSELGQRQSGPAPTPVNTSDLSQKVLEWCPLDFSWILANKILPSIKQV